MGQNFHKIEAVRLEGGDPTVGQFGPSGGQIKAIFIFAIFLKTSSKNVAYHHDGTPKTQLLCVDSVARQVSEHAPGSILAQKSPFVYVTPI